MCVPGVNLRVGLTHHNDELRRLARKASKRVTPELIEKISITKEMIKDTKIALDDHLSWCDTC